LQQAIAGYLDEKPLCGRRWGHFLQPSENFWADT